MEHSEPIESVDLLLEHAGWLRRLARDLVHDAHAADDLVQDTWLAFLRARPDTGRPLRPWLAGVVRNAAALRRRRSSSRAAREADTARGEALPSTGELIERAEVQQDLARGVLALEEPYRGVILLRFYEGLSPKQIADARGVPAATVRSQLHRGLARLRERLDARHDGDRGAWMALLSPLALRVENEAGASVAAAAVAAALVVVSIGAAAWWANDDRAAGAAVEPPAVVASSAGSGSRAIAEGPGERTPVIPASAAADDAAPRTWTIVDERTGRPLADFALRVADETLRTDASGAVVLPGSAAAFVPVDDPEHAIRERAGHAVFEDRAAERDAVTIPPTRDDAANVVRVASGPAFALDAGASDVRGWRAELASADDARGAALIGSVRGAANPVVQPDGGPWVRFAATSGSVASRSAAASKVASAATLRLSVRDDAGYRFAAAVFPATTARVALDVRRTGVVDGRISGLPLDDSGAGVLLALEPAPERSAPANPITVAPDAAGAFRFAWIEPGAYRLSVRAAGQSPWWIDVDVRADETTSVDEAFDAAPTAGPVAGTIESASGDYDGQLLVFLRDADGVVHGVFPTTWQRDAAGDGDSEDDGAARAAFRFDPAPTGPLHLDVVSLRDAATVRVDPPIIHAPMDDVRVRVRDDVEHADWAFEVVDDATGAALERFTADVRFDDGAARRYLAGPPPIAGAPARPFTLHVGGMRWNRFESAAPLRALPVDARFAWTVTAEGYAAATGTHADFDVVDARRRTVRVSLRADR